MTMILKIVSIGIVYLLISSMVKEYRNDYVLLLRFSASIIIIMIVADEFAKYLSDMFSVFEILNIDSIYVNTILKVSGISVVTDFIYNSLVDSGEMSIAHLISICSRVIIIGLSMPMLNSLIMLCTEMLN